MITLPTYEEAERAVESGTAGPIDVFIYNNEPAGEVDEKMFRDQLQEVLNFLEK